jgi:predicted PurR-regulated permease PerM
VATLGVFVLGFFLLGYIFIPALFHQARNLAEVDYDGIVSSLEEPINDWEDWLIRRGLIEDYNLPVVPVTEAPEVEEDVVSHYIELDSMTSGYDTMIAPVIHLMVHVDHHDAPVVTPEVEPHKTFFDITKDHLVRVFDPSIIPSLISSVVGKLGNVLLGIMSVFFIAFFFLREQGLFNNMISSAVSNQYEDKTHNAIEQSTELLVRYFIGVLLQITVVTVFVSLLLSIFGIKNALLIGFFAALMNVIPYLGPIIGATFGVIITVSSNLDVPFYDVLLPMLVKVMLVFMIMQLLDNFILQPTIFSKSVKAHPLEIFLVILVAAEIGGVVGMVLAIPVYTVLRVIGKVFLSEFKIVQKITQGL